MTQDSSRSSQAWPGFPARRSLARRATRAEFVRIDELPDSPPSYLVLLAHDEAFPRGCGDYWAEIWTSLEQFFTEGQWIVEWPRLDS
ncbi:hypothetical protein ACFVTY_24720 [Streptomyces sp. NPDC058067]|uniref:hypothetical protein n=1 Tax=Streptomyces sp. NPDC058067 TaxID=3346324 RepID=UPI0036EE8312